MKGTYAERLKDPRWQKKRLEILSRDDFTCRLCSDKDSTLHVHHLRYERGADPWDYPGGTLVTVCESCHEELHSTNFGALFIEELVQAGADLISLFELLSAIEASTISVNERPMTTRQWRIFCEVIFDLTEAIKRGATTDEIRGPLERIRKDGGAEQK